MARRQGYEVGHIASKATPKGKPRPKIGRKVTPRAGALTPTLVPGRTRTSPRPKPIKPRRPGVNASKRAKAVRKARSY